MSYLQGLHAPWLSNSSPRYVPCSYSCKCAHICVHVHPCCPFLLLEGHHSCQIRAPDLETRMLTAALFLKTTVNNLNSQGEWIKYIHTAVKMNDLEWSRIIDINMGKLHKHDFELKKKVQEDICKVKISYKSKQYVIWGDKYKWNTKWGSNKCKIQDIFWEGGNETIREELSVGNVLSHNLGSGYKACIILYALYFQIAWAHAHTHNTGMWSGEEGAG